MDTKAQHDVARTAEFLGGKKVLLQQVHNRLEVHDLLERGLPSAVLDRVVKKVAILNTQVLLEKTVGISVRTLQRNREAPRLLSPEQSGRTWKFAEILARAIDVFGSQKEAEAWLDRPAMPLNQRKPIDLLSTTAGVESIEELLTRIEYGVYT
jgi:putative toxin-antitoxin system antitoxin component (TIGR02293 family)